MTNVESFADDERLAVYGSLQPGGSNEHILRELPGIRLSPDAPRVPVHVFCSHQLPTRWAVLDEFEGPEYWRSM